MNTQRLTVGSFVVSGLLLLTACQQSATINHPTLSPAAVTAWMNPIFIHLPSYGPAAIYPSTINVSGVTGSISQVTVTLHNMNHTWTSDFDILLVSPTGRGVMLMSDIGGSSDLRNATLTFDDTAPPVPNSSPILSGTYRPTNWDGGDIFPAPAPAIGHYSRLNAFNNLSPNGDWKLYVFDDTGGDSGNILNGWSLNITTTDTTPPTITINTPADGAQYPLGQELNANYSCADETSLEACVGMLENGEEVASGAAIDTSTIGNYAFAVKAQDGEGNTTVLTHSYNVVYPFSGFFQPVDNPGSGSVPLFNRSKAGSAIPVKFSLGGDRGLNIFPTDSPASRRINCDGSATLDPIEETVTAGSSSLKYDPGNNMYSYVWKTDKAWANTCRLLIVTLDDSTEHVAYFNFTR